MLRKIQFFDECGWTPGSQVWMVMMVVLRHFFDALFERKPTDYQKRSVRQVATMLILHNFTHCLTSVRYTTTVMCTVCVVCIAARVNTVAHEYQSGVDTLEKRTTFQVNSHRSNWHAFEKSYQKTTVRDGQHVFFTLRTSVVQNNITRVQKKKKKNNGSCG